MKIVADSHLDHGLSPAHVAWLVERFADRQAFFIETVELPAQLTSLTCGLHGPATGDEPVPEAECHRAVRGERKGPSRLCTRETKTTRMVTVIAGPDGPEPCVLYTAYGGPSAPREPWDESLDDAGRAEAEAFWAQHALSAEVAS
jgi:hypothetical protein